LGCAGSDRWHHRRSDGGGPASGLHHSAARGRDGPETPVALVERGTWPGQQVATGTLETIVDARDEAGIEPPAVTVIGDVAGTRESVVDFLQNDYGAAADETAESGD